MRAHFGHFISLLIPCQKLPISENVHVYDHLFVQIPHQNSIEYIRRAKEDWASRVVVEDIRQHFHRVLPETELRQKGFYSSNQLDRLRGQLKDPVYKPGLQGVGPDVNAIPPLSVVNNPLVDTEARRLGLPLRPAIPETAHAKFCGFNPGQFTHSWAADDNHIPCYDYEHQEFIASKGQDFK